MSGGASQKIYITGGHICRGKAEHHKKITLPAAVICPAKHHKKFTSPVVTFAEARQSIIKKIMLPVAVICPAEHHKKIYITGSSHLSGGVS